MTSIRNENRFSHMAKTIWFKIESKNKVDNGFKVKTMVDKIFRLK